METTATSSVHDPVHISRPCPPSTSLSTSPIHTSIHVPLSTPPSTSPVRILGGLFTVPCSWPSDPGGSSPACLQKDHPGLFSLSCTLTCEPLAFYHLACRAQEQRALRCGRKGRQVAKQSNQTQRRIQYGIQIAHLKIPALRRERPEDKKLKPSLGYITRSRPAWAT